MIFAVDVHYRERYAKAVGVLFNWEDEAIKREFITLVEDVKPYEPGAFYKRELPCILEVLNRVDIKTIETIVIDGFVYIDNNRNYGLGAHLFEALKEEIPIIGVAKRPFLDVDFVSMPILRGNSKQPLYISSIGMDLQLAAEKIKQMHGENRNPTILKRLDQITKED